MMYLLDTKPMALQTVHCNKQYSTLSIDDLGWDIARQIIHKTYLLTHNLCRCQSRAPDRCVVPLSDITIRHVIHVIAFVPGLSRKSVSSDNKLQDRKKA